MGEDMDRGKKKETTENRGKYIYINKYLEVRRKRSKKLKTIFKRPRRGFRDAH
jgi:hypothetical protein